MQEMVGELRRLYSNLLKDREVIETNLLKLRELIELNEKIGYSGEKISIASEKTSKESEKTEQTDMPVSIATSELTVAARPVAVPAIAAHTTPANSHGPYSEHMTWQQKILYTMTLMNRPATAKEIALQIKELEPNSRLSIDKSVELTTSRMSNAGQIVARKEGVKNYYSLLDA